MPEFCIRFASGSLSIDETHTKARGNSRFGNRESDTESPRREVLDLRLALPPSLFDQYHATRIRRAASRKAARAVPALSAVHGSRLLGSKSPVDFVVETYRRE
jgi:hypothetical protein